MKKNLFSLGLLLCFVFTSIPAFATIGPCSLQLIFPPNDSVQKYANPDSVKIDTCHGSSTYHHRFAAKWFRIEFKKVIFNIPAASNPDTVIQRTWRDIDTSQSAIRAGFDSVEVHYGTFILQKAYPDAGDTSNLLSQVFLLEFD